MLPYYFAKFIHFTYFTYILLFYPSHFLKFVYEKYVFSKNLKKLILADLFYSFVLERS